MSVPKDILKYLWAPKSLSLPFTMNYLLGIYAGDIELLAKSHCHVIELSKFVDGDSVSVLPLTAPSIFATVAVTRPFASVTDMPPTLVKAPSETPKLL